MSKERPNSFMAACLEGLPLIKFISQSSHPSSINVAVPKMDLESNPPTQQWADSARQLADQASWSQGSPQERAYLQTIDALEAMLNGQNTPAGTAHTIADFSKPLILGSGYAHDHIHRLWTTITDAVVHFDDSRSGLLADLVIAIYDLPDLLDSKGRSVSVVGSKVWRELPDWGWIFGEAALGSSKSCCPTIALYY